MSFLLRSSRLAVLALAAATGAHAAELGDASVRSHSGQPLSADIELTDLTAQELADLQVRLARPDVFQGANVKMNPALAGAQITVARRDSRRVLQVTTSAPVQAEVLHLYFQLVSGGRERVRGVTLWLSPAPASPPIPTPTPTSSSAPAALAAAPAPAPSAVAIAAERPARPVARLVATASPGTEATAKERELLGAVERAIASRGGKIEPAAPASSRPAAGARDVRKEALKYASTADDFRRQARPGKPAVAVTEAEARPSPKQETGPQAGQEARQTAAVEKKTPQPSFLPSRAELAEAARATKASVEAATQPAAQPKVVKAVETAPRAGSGAKPAGGTDDPAMLNKLAELEGKLKSLQAQLAMTTQAGAVRVTVPVPGNANTAPVAAPSAHHATATVKTPDAMTVAAAAAQPVRAAASAATPTATAAAPATVPAQASVVAPAVADGTTTEAAPRAQTGGEAAVAPLPEPEIKPQEKKEAAPPPPEPKKEIKISRPKLLTFLFAGSLVLLVIFGVIVHFIRKAKLKRSPIVRQSWSREDDDIPARVEPAIAPAGQPESRAA
ncbi:type IV pilus assembly protein FimV [Pseudoduganella umbonata]|uniref:Pilus assembly protein FimV n=1 Tax=Pseudoduganella umbonata TaxID=864828 RepID=A0A4P8HYK6_9BURK|nr:hypothetical protein [Pseudoduganella umbonata]MBB3223331.1 pilus assembly protein FimV [Pseudoduganella umbonata]QCP13760.1 hypothetical protein FCL38_27510 [Pseudoduganella umbonata]